MNHDLLVYLALVPILGVIAQLLAYWSKLPSILLLLVLGVLLGTFISPDEIFARLLAPSEGESTVAASLLAPIISLSVAVVLFEGGLTLRLSELKASGKVVYRLIVYGAVITWLLATVFAIGCLGFDWRLATLLGAILTVTGPTVVAPMLRYIRPNKKISAIVKWEGIIIDPVGAILAVLVFENFFHGGDHFFGSGTLRTFAVTLISGSLISVIASAVIIFLFRRFLIPEYLHGFAVLGLAIAVFTISNRIADEAGLVSVTLLGIVLANQKWVSIDHVIEFKENLRVFLVSGLFIVLGSQLRIDQILDLGWPMLLFLAALIVIVRPISVFVALLGTDTTARERLFLAFLAPRGIVAAAVTSVFALRIAQLDETSVPAEQLAQLVPTTFTVIIGSVAFYGLTAAPFARRLGLADANPQGVLFAGGEPWARSFGLALKKAGFTVAYVDTNYANVAAAKMDGMSAYCVSILSEHVPDDVDFAGIGKLLAVTHNDLVNTIASKTFAHFFGKKNVYQILPSTKTSGRRVDMAAGIRGRSLFAEGVTDRRLEAAYAQGYRCKATRLTAEYSYDQFKQRNENDFILLAMVDSAGSLQIATASRPLKPTAGNTLYAMVREPSEQKPPTADG